LEILVQETQPGHSNSPAYCPLGKITAACEQAIREVQKGDGLTDIAAVGPAW
jgi:hypothetical protein